MAFKRCFSTLVTTINYNLETILDRALAKELITDAHQTKWLDKNTFCDERTRQFLVYIQTRIRVEAKAFKCFVGILQQDTADFMGRELKRKLEEVEEMRAKIQADTHTSTPEECEYSPVLKLIDMQRAYEDACQARSAELANLREQLLKEQQGKKQLQNTCAQMEGEVSRLKQA